MMMFRWTTLLLTLLLGSLTLFQTPSHGPALDPTRQAAAALGAWLGGPVALCLPGSLDGPMPDADPAGHACCPPSFGRGLDVPPPAVAFPIPCRGGGGHADQPTMVLWGQDQSFGPQQPRAPPPSRDRFA